MTEPETENNHALPSYAVTHQGKVRDHNEDTLLDRGEEGLWLVADGAGGHEKGEVASQLIVDTLAKFRSNDVLSANVAWLVAQLRLVNQTLIDMREEIAGGGLIGSTVAALLLHKNHVACLWSGDSRVYLYRNQQLFLLTQDHNRWEEFIRLGFDEHELKQYPAANQLIKAVGATSRLSLDVQLYEHRPGDIFLICSDGLSGELTEQEITKHLATEQDARQRAEALLEATLQCRAGDNISAIVIG